MARRLVISAPAFLIGKINSPLGTQSTRLISACLSSLIKFAPMLCAQGARACRFRDYTSVFPFGIKMREISLRHKNTQIRLANDILSITSYKKLEYKKNITSLQN